jgi:hypothetical protein
MRTSLPSNTQTLPQLPCILLHTCTNTRILPRHKVFRIVLALQLKLEPAQPLSTMSNLIDAEAGTERFGSYEAELKLVQADLNQQLDEIPELSGEPRKAAVAKAERALEEANELVSRCLVAQTMSKDRNTPSTTILCCEVLYRIDSDLYPL